MIYFDKQIAAMINQVNWFKDWRYSLMRKLHDIKHDILAPWYFLTNVWRFRKELWKFRQWDYSFNLAIFTRSLEITAEHLASEHCVCENGDRDAADIRKFLKMLEISENSIPEAERILGVDYMDTHSKVYPLFENRFCDVSWQDKPREEWNQDQKNYQKFSVLIPQLEERNWRNAWKFYARKGRNWWD